MKHTMNNKITFAGILVAMGVVYGDIGTSPLYVMKALVYGNGGINQIDDLFVLGAISLIFWTLTLLTTIKYVIIALKADNHGEGGIFSLYTLVRQRAKWLIVPAMIGGATLLADGVLTPAVTVTTAIEGLVDIPFIHQIVGSSQNNIIIITLVILLFLFMFQRFGTEKIGKAFGPIMFGWFTLLGALGLYYFVQDVTIIRALSPHYAIQLLMHPTNRLGIFILGNIFLATTGAEALYSDMGHVGKFNIYGSWPYIKICLILFYLGQGVWLLEAKNSGLYPNNTGEEFNPFFEMIPEAFSLFGVLYATVAAVIASQALLSGSFTLVSEAIKLRLFPRLSIKYPGNSIGQLYIPVINWILWALCSLIVITFRTSARMEAAYGLAITLTMLMTTVLLYAFLRQKGLSNLLAFSITGFFGLIESIFFISSLAKFLHGGFVAILIALAIVLVMLVWEESNRVRDALSKETDIAISDYIPQLAALSSDQLIDKYQTNIVFLVPNMDGDRVGREFLYSILDKHPKRADVYWFVHINVTDEPNTRSYHVDILGDGLVVLLTLNLGFRQPQSLNLYLRQIIQQLIAEGRLPKQHQTYSLTPGREVGDFTFVLISEEVSTWSQLSKWQHLMLSAKVFIKQFTATPARWFGLQYSEVKQERIPLVFDMPVVAELKEV